MNGAESLARTLVAGGVNVCFTNPGTSEMHFVQAMDRVPAMRAILAVFEGVATGAADGYARITGRPAAVLLHLGPGLANGLVLALIAYLWKGSWLLALILGVALVFNMVVAAVVGTLVPIALKTFRVDPAIASSVIITTFTDVCGFFSFLGLATLLMRFLL